MNKVNHYELTTIIDSNTTDDQHPGIIEEIKKTITKNKGEINSEENLGRKKLNYAIKKALKGVFITIEFDLNSADFKNIEKELKLNKNILRYLIIKKPKNVKKIEMNKKPSSFLEQKKEKVTEEKTTPKKEIIPEKKEESKAKFKTEEQPSSKNFEREKTNLDELDEKLDKILNDEIIN